MRWEGFIFKFEFKRCAFNALFILYCEHPKLYLDIMIVIKYYVY